MDDARFDDLARMLSASSRRTILAGAAALALLLGRPTLPEILAKKRKKHKKKRRKGRKPAGTNCQAGTRPCGSTCLTPDQCCDDADCDPRQSCNDANACACRGECGDAECGDDGCGGSCGECGAGERCQDGQCVCAGSCAGKACGDDGCGVSCGSCLAAETCQQDQCVCGTPDGVGPGDICTSVSDCCPYTDISERRCDRGMGGCQSFMPVCRYGFGGKCTGNCDCLVDLVCQDGSCRCAGNENYLGGGICCDPRDTCGPICCPPGFGCLCVPGFDCRCTLP